MLARQAPGRRAEPAVHRSSDPSATAIWQQLARWSGNRGRGELLTDIGLGRKIATISNKAARQLLIERGERPDPCCSPWAGMRFRTTRRRRKGGGADRRQRRRLDQMAYLPSADPGDDIVGYLGRGEGLNGARTDDRNGKRHSRA